MKIEDLTKLYPPKSFSEKFEEKKNAFVAIGAQASDFTKKQTALKRIFDYDQTVKSLKDVLDEQESVDEAVGNEIKIHFQRINELCQLLEEQLNTTNPKDIKTIFDRFDDRVRKMGFLGFLVYKTSEDVEVRARESVVDIEIKHVERLISALKGPEESTSQLEGLDLDKLKQAEKLADKIVGQSERYQKAATAAENWIEKEGQAVSSAIKDKTEIFDNKAKNEHTKHHVWWWLVAAFIFVAGAITTSLLFIDKLSGNGEGISIGAALLRISVVAMFFYLSYLAYQQFSIQRKLYETYKFKAIALSTMEDLVQTYTEHNDREMIVSKAIEIVFTEPSFKEDKVAHKRMIDELMDILKKKM